MFQTTSIESPDDPRRVQSCLGDGCPGLCIFSVHGPGNWKKYDTGKGFIPLGVCCVCLDGITGIRNNKHVIPAIIDFALIWTLNSLRAMARTAAQESSKRSCKGNTACNRTWWMLWTLPNWRTTPEFNKLDARSSPLFTMVHHCSLTAYIYGITTISLVGFTWACPMLRSAWEMLSSHQDSINAPPIPCPHLNWFLGDLAPKKVNPNSYHQLVTIWIRINSGYLKLLTHPMRIDHPKDQRVNIRPDPATWNGCVLFPRCFSTVGQGPGVTDPTPTWTNRWKSSAS